MAWLLVVSLILLSPTSETKPVWNEVLGKWLYSEGDQPNVATELGSQKRFFEGDIYGIPRNAKLRNGIYKSTRWPGGIIPFLFSTYFNDTELKNITLAMTTIQSKTCIKFKPRTNEPDYVNIENTPNGCYSYVGKRNGSQILSLQRGTFCTRAESAMHELLHAAGLYHEHSRYDRDPYLTINLANVAEEDKPQFRKIPQSESYVYGAPFDYGSIMLYSRTAGAVNRSINVLITTDPTKQNTIGHAKSPSQWDVYKINKIYDCKGSGKR